MHLQSAFKRGPAPPKEAATSHPATTFNTQLKAEMRPVCTVVPRIRRIRRARRVRVRFPLIAATAFLLRKSHRDGTDCFR